MQDGILIADSETGIVLDVNPWFLSATGSRRDQVVGRKLTEIEPMCNLPLAESLMPSLRTLKIVRFEEFPLRKADGSTIGFELVGSSYRLENGNSAVQLSFHDISARKKEQEFISKSLDEKSQLIREIHHRVKNNLQVILSLLSLQASYKSDPAAKDALEQMERRVRAIARVYETFYASVDLAQIEFATYLTNLVSELLGYQAGDADAITLELAIEDLVLPMEKAIPLGLIANELILNSLKHGLAKRQGKLSVSLSNGGDTKAIGNLLPLGVGWARLEVRDDGPGLPPSLEVDRSASLGFRLLHLLVKQLRGKITFLTGLGTNIQVDFPLSHPVM